MQWVEFWTTHPDPSRAPNCVRRRAPMSHPPDDDGWSFEDWAKQRAPARRDFAETRAQSPVHHRSHAGERKAGAKRQKDGPAPSQQKPCPARSEGAKAVLPYGRRNPFCPPEQGLSRVPAAEGGPGDVLHAAKTGKDFLFESAVTH
jgi:hypothetical protein